MLFIHFRVFFAFGLEHHWISIGFSNLFFPNPHPPLVKIGVNSASGGALLWPSEGCACRMCMECID